MKIVPIFAEWLYAIQYDGEEENEYDRLLDLWMDISYLRSFAKTADIIHDTASFVDQVAEDAEDIESFMDCVADGEIGLSNFFKPLHNHEIGFRELSLQKGRPNRKSYLRLYAIEIAASPPMFLITGGAIKLVRTMQEDETLMKEKSKLNAVRQFLKENHVFDSDSFQDFKMEQDENE